MNKFNPKNLQLARSRRQLTIKSLAEAVGLSPRIVALYEKDYCTYEPKERTIAAYENTLKFPRAFLLDTKKVEFVDASTVSFRSLKSMKASQQHAAIAAGSIGLLINKFYEERFNLPACNLLDLRGCDAITASKLLRDHWRLGLQSIDNIIHLLEIHGVRVFSLAENTASVDAFSFWKDDVPYVFLNTQKSGERSRFDAAHELAHLILHKHGSCFNKDVEKEADEFAAHFLMPAQTVLPYKSKFIQLDQIIDIKANWKTSAMALIVHMFNVGALTEWQHRQLIIDASKKGLRKKEINGISRETSLLHSKMIESMQHEGKTISKIAEELQLPLCELTSLVFKLGSVENQSFGDGTIVSDHVKQTSSQSPELRVVR